METKEIYFAGGCFWGTEHFMKQIRGVIATQTGYANSIKEHPTYQEVCSGTTKAAETVRVVYDPSVLKLELLLQLYFKTIDPTSINCQGEDHGLQYRTGIYYTDTENTDFIRQSLQELQRRYEQPVAIELLPLENFYPAEDYHQDYLDKNANGYCHISLDLFKIAREANKE